ncbi:KilA-N domain-containing protein [Neisseria polysaccharea]|uniref:KilA-N domain-containing protein n=1 Tax=Neisseria polysaccharea TaxID=489 RepID=UPI0027E0B6E9|nr:KilA-N domain-containing protein [Neisseria polysaccharea]
MNQVQSFNFGNVSVSFRDDGYLNATAIAAHFGKRVPDFIKTEQNQEYINALAEHISKTTKIVLDRNQLVIVKHGGNNRGTWLHPKLAIHFARWLNPKFAVWCDEQIEALLNKVSDGIKTVTPKPTRALPNGLTGEQIEAVKKLHNALTKSAPKEAQARIAITLWSAVKSKFGCSYKEVPAEQFPEVLSVMSRVAVENGVLYGEVLDAPPKAEPKLPISSNTLYDLAAAVRYGAYAIQIGKDVSAPLRQLGCKQAVRMWTVWAETRSRLKAAANALEALSAHADAEHAAKIRSMLPEIRNLSAV